MVGYPGTDDQATKPKANTMIEIMFFMGLIVLFGWIGSMVTDNKGMGWLLGCLLGPIGILIAAVMK